MDWIERFFGFSPDNGSGLTETLIGLCLVVLLLCLLIAFNVFGLRSRLRRWIFKR
jgi:hypothetical protein